MGDDERDNFFYRSRYRFRLTGRRRFYVRLARSDNDVYGNGDGSWGDDNVYGNGDGDSTPCSHLHPDRSSGLDYAGRLLVALVDDVKRHCGIHQSRSRFCLAGLRRLDQRFAVFDNDLHDDRDGRGWHGDVFDDRYCHASAAPASGLFALAFREPARVEHSKRDLGHDSQFGRFSRHTKSIRDKRLSHVRPSSFDGYPYVYANRKRARRH